MENQKDNRRNFIKKAAIGGLMAISIPEILSAAMVTAGKVKKYQLNNDNIILFQGDSITDSGRNKTDTGYNNSRVLGTGYPMLAAAYLLEKYPSKNLKIYNKGISGNKVFQLAERWDKECIEIKPDILSILIGVNDYWHRLDPTFNGTIEIYRKDFIALLERTKKALPNVKLVIGEPFGVPGIKAVDETWYPGFYDYQKAAREIAESFGAVFIPYQSVFDQAQKRAPGIYWTQDGVHPTLAGAQLMAQAWLETVK
jgi:lysophospholipase L1-like esterase